MIFSLAGRVSLCLELEAPSSAVSTDAISKELFLALAPSQSVGPPASNYSPMGKWKVFSRGEAVLFVLSCGRR